MRVPLSIAALAIAALTLPGCGRNEAAQLSAAAPPPQVSVAQVVARQVTEFDEFTGRFEAVERVEIRPRVSGYIASVNFAEGSEVKKGDVLFVIDQRPYEADYKHAKAQLDQARSQSILAKSERDRAIKLLQAHAISQEEYDTRTAGTEQADANVEAAQAALDTSALNMTFTRITAPISGRISRALVTTGNLVATGQTLLTTLVSLDPIYVRFDGDEQAYLRYTKLAREGSRASSRDAGNSVMVGLADEPGYPHQGVMVFVDNELDPTTGTIRGRARLDNHNRAFTPGLFARVKLMGSGQYNALLINDSAIGTDQTVKYVLVVGTDNKVEYRPVKLGPIIDGLRVVTDGLKPGETIVVSGLQRVRPGSPVTPDRVAMGERRRGAPETLLAHNARVAQNDTPTGLEVDAAAQPGAAMQSNADARSHVVAQSNSAAQASAAVQPNAAPGLNSESRLVAATQLHTKDLR
ncbi:MAG: efflux transporter, family, subunit [Gammaproteobacteria bacterium]|nr:efflux transporter, family, subunit [Gammaproteobacteria bacterium]